MLTLAGVALVGGGVVAIISDDNDSGDDGDGDLEDQIYNPGDFETDEYKATGKHSSTGVRSGLEIINASYRYSFGATGDGVLVSVLDSGIDIDHPEFDGKIHEESKTYFFDSEGNSPALDDTNGHGTFVAALIAGHKDDEGMHGVAFESDLLILQDPYLIDEDEYKANIAAGYTASGDVWSDAWNTSVEAGAIAMNNSWDLTEVFIDAYYRDDDDNLRPIDREFLVDYLDWLDSGDLLGALTNAAENEMITVFAAGNDSYYQVGLLAGLPVYFPELEDTWLAVAATNQDDEIAWFSNYCGMAMNFCISAPGVDIYSAYPGGGYAAGGQGTSYAAPLVSGAVALLKHQFPSMGGAQIVQLIKETATDLGEEGVDAIYGHGLLNLGEAMSPQGTMMVAVGSDVRTAAAAPLNQTHIAPTGPVGAALAGTLGDKQVAALDDFARPYYIPLSALSIDSGSGFGKGWNAQADYLLALGQGNDRIKAPMLFGSAVLSNAIRPCLGGSSLNQAYLLAHGGDCSSSVVWVGDTSLSLSLSDLSDQQSQGVYSAFDVGVPFAAGVLELGFGVLDERESLLGSPLSGGFAIDGRAQTAFLRSGYQRPIASDWLGFVNLAVGETSYGSSGILSDAELTTWSWSAGLHTTDLLRSDDVLALSVKTPLSVSSGHVDYELPSGRTPSTDGRQTYGLTTTRIREELGSEDVVPLDLAVSYGMDLGDWDVNVGLMARTTELQVDDYIVNLNMGFSF